MNAAHFVHRGDVEHRQSAARSGKNDVLAGVGLYCIGDLARKRSQKLAYPLAQRPGREAENRLIRIKLPGQFCRIGKQPIRVAGVSCGMEFAPEARKRPGGRLFHLTFPPRACSYRTALTMCYDDSKPLKRVETAKKPSKRQNTRYNDVYGIS